MEKGNLGVAEKLNDQSSGRTIISQQQRGFETFCQFQEDCQAFGSGRCVFHTEFKNSRENISP